MKTLAVGRRCAYAAFYFGRGCNFYLARRRRFRGCFLAAGSFLSRGGEFKFYCDYARWVPDAGGCGDKVLAERSYWTGRELRMANEFILGY